MVSTIAMESIQVDIFFHDFPPLFMLPKKVTLNHLAFENFSISLLAFFQGVIKGILFLKSLYFLTFYKPCVKYALNLKLKKII